MFQTAGVVVTKSDPVLYLMKCIFLFHISHANLVVTVDPFNRVSRGPRDPTVGLERLCVVHTAALTSVHTGAGWFLLQ